ncbi:unnamed protein product [Acanthoscelides obtectus]|uniref:Uncharacterized protein n=1 Tax=Acanthoscelides obtectus TaxID=200917 RepID=A0A9P0PGK8_ACAOB|nr:unnamed protein product [Acanthoscelides obtectus]CAK1627750.1 hypothetical protein AOBTE_LOCUS4806 [Acanthoscelides obtectus]
MLVAWLLLSLNIFHYARSQDDSLKSAIEAIDRRTRDLEDYEDNEYGYTLNAPEGVTFLKNYPLERSYDFGRPDSYLEDGYDPDFTNKRISSSFRERVEQDNQKQLEELVHLISSMDDKGRFSDDDYEDIIKQLWTTYRKPHVKNNFKTSRVDKKYYYPQIGLDGGRMTKRRPYTDETFDIPYFRRSEDDIEDEDDEDYSSNTLRKRFDRTDYKIKKLRAMYNNNPYYKLKRFAIAKRSNGPTESAKDEKHEHQRSSVKKQTDPKVQEELNDIFGNKISDSTTKGPDTKATTSKKETSMTTTIKPTGEKDTKEDYHPLSLVSQKPLQIKKKSIDWSDYFGLDRRKKSDSNDLDKEWLIERYHKSVALTKRRASELPMTSFRNHDSMPKKNFQKPTQITVEDLASDKLEDLDAKLKDMEDDIIDGALKYTGAHEGTGDPNEIQEIKDKVISRLAAAYSLEKMRNAFEEYKLTVGKQEQKNKDKEDDKLLFAEEKRVAVPRKQVLDEDIPEADNAIQCPDGDDECKQNYRTPNEIIENHFGTEECPAIEKACNDVATIIGQYGQVLRSACTMHQMCLLCSNNSWFSPTRQCNTLFLDKAYDLCKGNMACQKVAQRSVRYLIDVHRSLHVQPTEINDCELACPDIESSNFDLSSR